MNQQPCYLLALRVEGRGCLVEEEDAGVADEGPGDGNPLLLATCNTLVKGWN